MILTDCVLQLRKIFQPEISYPGVRSSAAFMGHKILVHLLVGVILLVEVKAIFSLATPKQEVEFQDMDESENILAAELVADPTFIDEFTENAFCFENGGATFGIASQSFRVGREWCWEQPGNGEERGYCASGVGVREEFFQRMNEIEACFEEVCESVNTEWYPKALFQMGDALTEMQVEERERVDWTNQLFREVGQAIKGNQQDMEPEVMKVDERLKECNNIWEYMWRMNSHEFC